VLRYGVLCTTLIAVVALLLGGCGSAGPNAAHAPEACGQVSGRAMFGPFAGYDWDGSVHQISAAVVVPRIVGDATGQAGTWIGAAGATNAKTLVGPFFQIGVNEIRARRRRRAAADSYYAFWSSTALGFHPRFLFSVRPGDVVRLSMNLVKHQWRMSVSDERSGSQRTFSVHAGRGTLFNTASWNQEDLSDSDSEQLPYPDVAAARFLALKVNSASPRPSSLQESWMSADVRTFGPTRLHADAFKVQHVYPSAAGLRYQQLLFSQNTATMALDYRALFWSQHTKPDAIRKGYEAYARVLERLNAGLRCYHWPTAVRALVARFIYENALNRQDLLGLAAEPAAHLLQETLDSQAGYEVPEAAGHALALKIRARLHIPPTNLSTPRIAAYSDGRIG
jgi:Peptidase A4 family